MVEFRILHWATELNWGTNKMRDKRKTFYSHFSFNFFFGLFFFRDDGEDYVDITEPGEDYERVIKLEKKKKTKTKTS